MQFNVTKFPITRSIALTQRRARDAIFVFIVYFVTRISTLTFNAS